MFPRGSPGACAVGDGAGGRLKDAEPAAHRRLAETAALSPLSGQTLVGPWDIFPFPLGGGCHSNLLHRAPW